MRALQKHFPVFSVITVTLNNHVGVQKTYDSLKTQSFTDYEWLVIDGGSKDETLDFLRTHRRETRNDRNPFRFVSDADEGIYDAMNTGIKEAKGRYLLFLNAGDRLASKDVFALIHPLTEKKPDFIYADALEETHSDRPPVYKEAHRYKDLAWGMITHHQAMFYRRNIVRDCKLHYSLLYDIAADYDFTVRFLLRSKKILYVPKPVCIFEYGGISQKKAALGRREQYRIRENLDMVPQAQNLGILLTQMMLWHLKTLCPPLYRWVRSVAIKRKKQPMPVSN